MSSVERETDIFVAMSIEYVSIPKCDHNIFCSYQTFQASHWMERQPNAVGYAGLNIPI